MDKCKDLSKFDKRQIVMDRWLVQSICKYAVLVGCSQSALVSISQKLFKEFIIFRYIRVYHLMYLRANLSHIVIAGSDRKLSE